MGRQRGYAWTPFYQRSLGPIYTGPFARYVAAVRAHVDEVHAIAAGGGVLGAALRGLVSTVTKLGASPSILHRDLYLTAERYSANPDTPRVGMVRITVHYTVPCP